ncbi:MAG: hypothetical protein J7K08_06005 [Thermoplasmata archaeon]|nr:hypothetical protein [Thermoplasmata archaeon]
MLFYHAIIGVGEGVITSATHLYLEHTAPEILKVSQMVKMREEVRA